MGYLIVYGGWFHITICNYVLMKFIARRAYGIVENNVTQTRYLVEVKGFLSATNGFYIINYHYHISFYIIVTHSS
jgi:hypothetical protein